MRPKRVEPTVFETNNEHDPWNELKPIVYLARSLGQGPGGLIITAITIIAAITEAVLAFYNVLYASKTWENTVKYVTEGGQVLTIYLSASLCGLVSALKRRDQDIINILKTLPLQEQYKSSVAYRKIFFKVLLLVPFFLFNFLFTEEIVYQSNWRFTSFYLPLTQLIISQLQLTTVLDILTRNMEKLTEGLSNCLGISLIDLKLENNQVIDKHCCSKLNDYYKGKQIKDTLNISLEDYCISNQPIFTVSNTRLRKRSLVKLIGAHELLQEAGLLVSSTFGLQTLVSLGRTFIIITFNTFLFVRVELVYHINAGDYLNLLKHSFSMITIVLIHLFELWFLVSSANSFAQSGERFTRNLFTAAIEDDTETLAKMDVVKSHIASKRDNTITAYGFLSVNYSLISYMLGAATTYIVIIIQMGNIKV